MAFTINGNRAVALLVLASTLAIAMANKDWYKAWPNKPENGSQPVNATNWYYGPYGHQNATQPKKVVVGGSDNWRFGFNYTDWALKNGPFYIGDSLVFKYDPPSNGTFPHSVYLLPNYRSFVNCDLRWSRKIADVTAGAGDGFEFVLRRWQPYYFACGERNGFHCGNGTMKFPVMPLIRWN